MPEGTTISNVVEKAAICGSLAHTSDTSCTLTMSAMRVQMPQYFALIFSIAEVPPFALLRSGSKVKDATVHIKREVLLCQWLHLFDVPDTGFPVLKVLAFIVTQRSPRLSESCASCPLLRQILRRLFVSPSVNDPPAFKLPWKAARP